MIKVYPPPPALEEYICCFWSLYGISGEHTELVYPNGKIQIIFHYRKPFTDTASTGDVCTQPVIALCGQKISYSHVISSEDSGMVAVVLKTHSASLFFPMPMSEVTGYTVDLNYIYKDWKNYHGRFNDCSDDNSRIFLVSRFLLDKLNNAMSCHDYFIKSCVDEIKLKKGMSAPLYSMDRFSFSERSLQRIFKERVGLSPKKFAEIVRLENSITMFGQGMSMSEVCQEAGYYDQPHFIKSFRQYTGLTPSEFAKFL